MLPNASLDIFRVLGPLDARRRLLYGDGIGPQILLNQVSTPARVLRCFSGWGVECEGIGDDLDTDRDVPSMSRTHSSYYNMKIGHGFPFLVNIVFFRAGASGIVLFWVVFFLLIVLSRQLWVRILTRGIP